MSWPFPSALKPWRAGTLPPSPPRQQATGADVAVITAAAFVANVFESYIGAAVQGRVAWLNNDLVNVLQISVAAGLAVAGKAYLLG